jgi:hypothetical protein
MNLYQPTITGSLSVSGSVNISGSITIAGGGTISGTASIATTALTASSADNLLVRNTLTAQTLVVQTITSSVDFVTGSTRFGSISENTHQFTGSMAVSGGASFNTAQNFTVRSTSTGWISSFTNDYNNTVYIGVDDGGMYMQPSSKGTKLVAGNGTTYLYVTSSGVGIGIANPSRTLDVTGTFRVITPNRSFFVTSNAYSISDGTLSSGFGMDGDGMYLGNVTSATGWTISNPQVTIRSSGNVGIGTSSPTGAAGLALVLNSGASQGRICIKTSATGDASEDGLQIGMAGSDAFIEQRENADLTFATNASERMRIDSFGRVTVNSPSTYVFTVSNTTNTSGQGVFVTSLGSANNNASSYHYIAATGGADRYYLFGNGTYQTVSDIRLKKNITTVTDTYLDKVNALRIVNYNWNDQEDGSDLELGMIAQEVEELIPSIVYEGREQEDGNVYKGIQVSSLPYILIKAIQELKAEFDAYKTTHP